MEMQGASIALILSTIFMSSVMSQDPPAVPAVPDVPGKSLLKLNIYSAFWLCPPLSFILAG